MWIPLWDYATRLPRIDRTIYVIVCFRPASYEAKPPPPVHELYAAANWIYHCGRALTMVWRHPSAGERHLRNHDQLREHREARRPPTRMRRMRTSIANCCPKLPLPISRTMCRKGLASDGAQDGDPPARVSKPKVIMRVT